MTTFDYLRFLFCREMHRTSWFGDFRELGCPTRALVGWERRGERPRTLARSFPLGRASWVIRKVYGIS